MSSLYTHKRQLLLYFKAIRNKRNSIYVIIAKKQHQYSKKIRLFISKSLLNSSYYNYKDIEYNPLHVNDYDKGFCDILEQLTICQCSKSKFINRFQQLRLNGDYYIVTAHDKNKIVGTATLIITKRFVHEAGKVGHIEDVVVDERYRGKSIGSILIKHLQYIADNKNCYKTLLDCKESNQIFYEKLGMKKEIQMVRYK